MRDFVSRIPIEKGWSGDKKYRAEDSDGNIFLLRISSIERLERCKTVHELMCRLDSLGIPMCRPVELGVCDEGIYMLQSFIDGEDAEDVIPTLPPKKQYTFGFEAGAVLRKIHTVPAPDNIPDWSVRYGSKIDRKLRGYAECSLKYDNGTAFFDFINANRHLIDGRPQCYQHGDYHIGNMMIGDNNLYIIDFDRFDFGDPWEEFNRIVWCVQASPPFASGMVDGYFEGNVPDDFWRLLALYISVNTLGSLSWAIPFGDAEINTMRNQAKEVLLWYENMTRIIPTWYKEEY